MRRRMIVLFCFLWGFVCSTVLYIYSDRYQNSAPDVSTEPEISLSAKNPPAVSFPTHLSGTDLIVKGLYPYDGAYWEDGSGREVLNVTALLVENAGSYGIDRARVVICQGERLLKFTVTTIPPGAQVVVLEQGSAGFRKDAVKYCYGSQHLQLDGWDLSVVQYERPDMGTLILSNPTEKPIRNLRLLYKDYLQGMYIGGVTNSHTVDEILPGETICVTPERFAGGISKILCILKDENATDNQSVA